MAQILVVDDSATERRFARELLQAVAGWAVVEAADGEQALQLLARETVDLVVTDLQMPNLDGLQLVSAIRTDHPDIPVILMTARGSEEIAVRALQEGAASYVPKRVLGRQLVDVAHQVLDISKEDKAYGRLLAHMTGNDCRFTLTNDLQLISSLISFLRQGVTRMRICDEGDQFRLAVALEEALLNAYYHGNLEVSSKLREQDHRAFCDLAEQRRREAPFQERRIFVHANLSPEEATFVVRDEGPGFDHQQLPDPRDPENLAKPSGRGVLLMRTFMDEVTYNEAGNEVTMIKRRAHVEHCDPPAGEAIP